jgi:hypothetical protein
MLDADDRELLARWKFQHFPSQLRRTLDLLAGNDQPWADELTRRAVACNDDLGAWLIAQRMLPRSAPSAARQLRSGGTRMFGLVAAMTVPGPINSSLLR